MATEKLFGNHISPACKYCTQAMQQVGENILCIKRGIVTLEYYCKRFDYDPTKRIPPRLMPMNDYDDEDFSIT